MGVHKVPTVHLELADPRRRRGRSAGQVRPREPDRRHARRRGRHAQRARRSPTRSTSSARSSRPPAAIDASYVELHVPVARLADALPIMADVVARPTFPEAELKRLREERLASLLESAGRSRSSSIQFAFPRLVFGAKHRYGTPSIGTAASLKAITAADLKAFHAAQYRPSNARAGRRRRRHRRRDRAAAREGARRLDRARRARRPRRLATRRS